jgi:hypothetical protein
MANVRMLKGKNTELTYRVEVRSGWISWECHVYEPYMKRRLWGLLPDVLAYRHVYKSDRGPICDYIKPVDIQSFAERTLRDYESHKLAWEAHGRQTTT